MRTLSDRSHLIGNAVLFQGTWFACVLGGAVDAPVWGYLGVALLLGTLIRRPGLQSDLLLMAVLGAFGFALDTLWIRLDLLSYGGAQLAPGWILALWLGFALTVNHSLAWLKAKPLLAGVLAAGSAPLTYLGGERLGAVVVVDSSGLGMISAAWAVVFYLVFSLAGRAGEFRFEPRRRRRWAGEAGD